MSFELILPFLRQIEVTTERRNQFLMEPIFEVQHVTA